MQTKLCPNCHKRKDLDKFGKRKINNVIYNQSQCKACRGVKNVHQKRDKITHTSKKNPSTGRVNTPATGRGKRVEHKSKQPRSPSRRELEVKLAQLDLAIKKAEAQLQ